ncbi:MAG: DUF4115 domain-containing protein [Geobacter sp.]|nr:DUF4115 domain-containing protein [Geobacter sp.]
MPDIAITPPESASNSPGAILKRCREYHALSLEDAAETTKIGISYLKALEEDQTQEFANLAYLKGFLRIYAAYLGLNSDDMARMYDKQGGVKSEDTADQVCATDAGRPARRLVSLKKLVLPAFLLLLIILTATFFKPQTPSIVRPAQPQPVTVPVAPSAPVQQIISSAKPKPAPAKIAEQPTASEPDTAKVNDKPAPPKRPADTAAKGFVLKIRVIQNGFMTVTVDGSSPQYYDLNVGDLIEWKAEKGVAIDASNAGGIEIELNGKPYKQLGSPGKPAYVELDADGIKP